MIEVNIFSLIAVCVSCFTLGMSITHSIWSKKFLTYILAKPKESEKVMELIVREKDYYVHTIKFNDFQIAEINNKFGIWMNSISHCFKTFDNEKDAKIYFELLCEFINTGRIFDK